MIQTNLTQLKPPKLIKVLLVASGMNQNDLANKLGVSPAAISRKLSGNIHFSADELSTMADLFHVSTDYLLGREPMGVE